MRFTLPPVYPITDKALAGRRSHLEILRELARGGATLVQIRDKETPVRELLEDLRRCVEFARARDIRLIVNDRCDLALCSAAGGVHLGQEDLPPEAARAVLGPESIIGFSTHSISQVRRAQGLPLDYLGFGPVFTTSTKAAPSPVTGLKNLARACREAGLPVVAIGGVGPSNIRDVIASGAASAAVISSLMTAKSIARRMAELRALATGTE